MRIIMKILLALGSLVQDGFADTDSLKQPSSINNGEFYICISDILKIFCCMIIKVVQMCPINRIAFGPKPLHGILVTLCVIRIPRKS